MFGVLGNSLPDKPLQRYQGQTENLRGWGKALVPGDRKWGEMGRTSLGVGSSQRKLLPAAEAAEQVGGAGK